MSDKECKVFYKVSEHAKIIEDLSRFKKYIDGLAFDETNLEIIKDVLNTVKDVFDDRCEILLMGSRDALVSALNLLSEDKFKLLIALSKAEDLVMLRQKYGGSSNLEFGIYITKPTMNLSQFTKQGVKFVVMPPSLIRGRLISEAKARKVGIVAYPVNDASTYMRLLELGVEAAVTTDPAIKREARKLLKL